MLMCTVCKQIIVPRQVENQAIVLLGANDLFDPLSICYFR